jgi:hypothetical protein
MREVLGGTSREVPLSYGDRWAMGFNSIFPFLTLDRWHNFRTLCDYSKRIAVGKSMRVLE